MRYAIYFTPAADHPLTVKASEWLGRNAFTGYEVRQPKLGTPDQLLMARYTQLPRRYGFHATIIAPFHLADTADEPELKAALSSFCKDRAAFALPKVEIRELGSFFALMVSPQPEELSKLEADAVEFFLKFRKALTAEELERRQAAGLTRRQQELLKRWGYPYVREEFLFHMTLTGRVAPEDSVTMRRALDEHFKEVAGQPLAFDRLAIFEEPQANDGFIVNSTACFQADSTRKIA